MFVFFFLFFFWKDLGAGAIGTLAEMWTFNNTDLTWQLLAGVCEKQTNTKHKTQTQNKNKNKTKIIGSKVIGVPGSGYAGAPYNANYYPGN